MSEAPVTSQRNPEPSAPPLIAWGLAVLICGLFVVLLMAASKYLYSDFWYIFA